VCCLGVLLTGEFLVRNLLAKHYITIFPIIVYGICPASCGRCWHAAGHLLSKAQDMENLDFVSDQPCGIQYGILVTGCILI